MLNNYKSPLGYVADGKKIDSYGVDHSGFSTKDEIKYQMARQRREKRLIDNYMLHNHVVKNIKTKQAFFIIKLR